MSSLFGDDSQYVHINFVREVDREPGRRTKRGGGPRPPTPVSRSEHGEAVASEIRIAIEATQTHRSLAGISPDNLVVLEFNSTNFDLRGFIEERFKGCPSICSSRLGRSGSSTMRTKKRVC